MHQNDFFNLKLVYTNYEAIYLFRCYVYAKLFLCVDDIIARNVVAMIQFIYFQENMLSYFVFASIKIVGVLIALL